MDKVNKLLAIAKRISEWRDKLAELDITVLENSGSWLDDLWDFTDQEFTEFMNKETGREWGSDGDDLSAEILCNGLPVEFEGVTFNTLQELIDYYKK